jgi:hypothetical protein
VTARGTLALLLATAASLALLASAAGAVPLAATSVATKTALRGHLPDLGDSPSLRVFPSAQAFDDYQASLGAADVFPASSEMTWVNFQTEILALYHRGSDAGGRCLRVDSASPNATFDADTVTLNLMWVSETCGAPSSAHHPFVIVALRKTAADGTAWISGNRRVCASPPDVDATACGSVSGTTSTATPSPTVAPTSSPTPTRSPVSSPSPTAGATSSPTASPSPTQQATSLPIQTATRAPTAATPTATLVALGSPAPSSTPPSTLVAGAFIGVGSAIVVLSLIFLARRGRDYEV